MLAVDLSNSMRERDFILGNQRVDRLTATKAVANQFIEQRAGDRIGLILFGSQAYLQAPLTFDRQTVTQLLNEALINIAGEKTAIGDAIGLAIKRLRGLKVYTIGIGPDPRASGSFFGMMRGARSGIDERTLARIAEQTGGHYFHASNTEQLARVYQQIDDMEPVESDARVYRPRQSLFYWPLGTALVLFCTAMLAQWVSGRYQ